ncbi:cysteine--tRNA ligase [Candidatus Nomurabacteria bacterium RIFCSPLOWO2_01_FULL_36_10b]|uniref:Cysteine--tRNA ligase n=1 Tax=Candidatus Nomurabacteria bacterium RIFCSPLOWO2_01_FULL_36_10b TaxID=1801766 RepID=A0A1F6WNT1_9BACT|nr:MAG: cysteine--tRNA ligase [Candidatus Nomurabacteria bacterium RIFCSPLOWO2_01_FULL_36_10b]
MLSFFNTLTRKKEVFTPIEPNHVRMYHCGPTVYDRVHIGNMRAFIFADIVRRAMEYNGYSVTQVMNITDIGHLISDDDTSEDKMTKALRARNMPVTLQNMLAIGQEYTDVFIHDIEQLNILIPNKMPKASDHITDTIKLISILTEKGHTYTTSDCIYFDTSTLSDYGKLGGLDIKNINSELNSRITENPEKKNPRDFALWKLDKTQGWQSPWGKGFPGWHIECSGMSMKYLGETFDIHTGGEDLAMVHHNNEIAQSECATGKKFVNYWLHNAFVNIGNDKMAKSSGTGITIQTLIDNGYNPFAYRLLLLQSHYRSPITFSWESMDSAQRSFQNLMQLFNDLGPDTGLSNTEFLSKFKEALDDDLATPRAFALVYSVLKSDIPNMDKRATLLAMDRVFGLDIEHADKYIIPSLSSLAEGEYIPNDVQKLINQRTKARQEKDWETSDRLRDEIIAKGFEVRD